MGASQSASSAEAAGDVWPPDWEDLSEERRKLARDAILSLSALPIEEFLAIDNSAHAIAPEAWRFDEYHAAAAAAVQEDIKLNKIIYKLVPRKLKESDFWRLYFSEVLFVLDSVKLHGQYPPPPPPPPAEKDAAFKKGAVRKVERPPPTDESSCALM